MKLMIRRDFKRCIRDPLFWQTFPEYSGIHEYVSRVSGCCGLRNDVYAKMIELVKAAPDKWKAYLKTDKIQLYYGSPKHVEYI